MHIFFSLSLHVTKSFKRDNGHIHVPISNENTRSLGFWLDRQKTFVRQYESTSTTNEVESYKRRRRYELLLSIGLTNLGGKHCYYYCCKEHILLVVILLAI